LKQNADEILAGSTKGIGKEDVKHAVVDTIKASTIAAGLASLGALGSHAVSSGLFEMPWKSIGRIAGAAGAATGAVSALSAYRNYGNRRAIYEDMEAIKNDSTDHSALKLLIKHPISTEYTPPTVVQGALNKFNDKAIRNTWLTPRIQGAYDSFNHNYIPDGYSSEAAADRHQHSTRIFDSIIKDMKNHDIPRDDLAEKGYHSHLDELREMNRKTKPLSEKFNGSFKPVNR
jgi:hypothetical protein